MKKRILIIALCAGLLSAAFSCKPKAQNITFAATITDIEADGILVSTAADVGFEQALIHMDEDCKPDFTFAPGQTVQLTIRPMVTRSIPPQATAVEVTLLMEAPDNGVASVTEGLDPMPMLTPGAGVTDAEAPDTLESYMVDMLPVFDAITRTMGIEGEQGYLPADAVFVWSVLAACCEDWGQTMPETRVEDDTVIVPASTMQGIALAAFGRTDPLPPLPEEAQSRVSHDEARDAYLVSRVAPSNASVTGIDTILDNGDGTYAATLGFYTSAGERLGGVAFTLGDAPEGSAYRYVVTDATAQKQ